MAEQLASEIWQIILNIVPICTSTMLCTSKYFSSLSLKTNHLNLQMSYYENTEDAQRCVMSTNESLCIEPHHVECTLVNTKKINLKSFARSHIRRLICDQGTLVLQQDFHTFHYVHVKHIIFTSQCQRLRMLRTKCIHFHNEIESYICDANVQHDLKILDIFYDKSLFKSVPNILNVEILIVRFKHTRSKIKKLPAGVKILCLIGMEISISNEIQNQCDVYYFPTINAKKFEYDSLFYHNEPSQKQTLQFNSKFDQALTDDDLSILLRGLLLARLLHP